MISRKAIVAWVFSAVVSVGMLAGPGAALAQEWNHPHHDNGWHKGWWDNHRRAEECARPRVHQGPPVNNYGYNRPYNQGYRWTPPVSNYNRPTYGYNQPGFGYNPGGSIDGMVNPRHPGLYWACDSGGKHCHWAQRPGYGSAYPQAGLNPYAYGNGYNSYESNGYNGNGYNSNYANGYYGNSQGGLGSLLGPLFGQQP